jgi:hypothetical protein
MCQNVLNVSKEAVVMRASERQCKRNDMSVMRKTGLLTAVLIIGVAAVMVTALISFAPAENDTEQQSLGAVGDQFFYLESGYTTLRYEVTERDVIVNDTVVGTVQEAKVISHSSYSDIVDLVIPPTVAYGLEEYDVTTIGFSAFGFRTSLLTVSIPDTVRTIEGSAFHSCYNLQSLTLPDSVKTIGMSAFFACTGLTSVDLGSVVDLGVGSFQHLPLTSITIPDTVTSIPSTVFMDSKLTSIVIPDSVKSIGGGAFQNCHDLASVVIPDSVASIGPLAFFDCRSLTSVTVPGSVDSIGMAAFAMYYVPDLGPQTVLRSIVLENGVTDIGDWAFWNCIELETVTIPSSVTAIGNLAFDGCVKLGAGALPSAIASHPVMPNWISIVYYSDIPTATAKRTVIGSSPNNDPTVYITLPYAVSAVFLGNNPGEYDIDINGSGDRWEFNKAASFWHYHLTIGHAVSVTASDGGSFEFTVDGDDAWPHFIVEPSGKYVVYVPHDALIEITATADPGYGTTWTEHGLRLIGDPSFYVLHDRDLTVTFSLPAPEPAADKPSDRSSSLWIWILLGMFGVLFLLIFLDDEEDGE